MVEHLDDIRFQIIQIVDHLGYDLPVHSLSLSNEGIPLLALLGKAGFLLGILHLGGEVFVNGTGQAGTESVCSAVLCDLQPVNGLLHLVGNFLALFLGGSLIKVALNIERLRLLQLPQHRFLLLQSLMVRMSHRLRLDLNELQHEVVIQIAQSHLVELIHRLAAQVLIGVFQFIVADAEKVWAGLAQQFLKQRLGLIQNLSDFLGQRLRAVLLPFLPGVLMVVGQSLLHSVRRLAQTIIIAVGKERIFHFLHPACELLQGTLRVHPALAGLEEEIFNSGDHFLCLMQSVIIAVLQLDGLNVELVEGVDHIFHLRLVLRPLGGNHMLL